MQTIAKKYHITDVYRGAAQLYGCVCLNASGEKVFLGSSESLIYPKTKYLVCCTVCSTAKA